MSGSEDLVNAVLATSRQEDDSRELSCADAFQLAEAHGVTLITITRICNQQKIRISDCQLGCFK